MQYKQLIAVDLDGTLFGADHQLSAKTIEAMHAVSERGHVFVIITGRSAHSASDRLSAMPASAHLLCSNGAYEYDRQLMEISWADAIHVGQAVRLRDQVLSTVPSACFGWESVGGLSYDEEFTHQAGGASTLEQGGANEQFGLTDVLKLYVRSPEYRAHDLHEKLHKKLDGQAEVSASSAPFIELTAHGVNKASGLSRIASKLGITAKHTIAFGDSLNDLPMLSWAGQAVAMANALNGVKAIADTHTVSNAEDGVAVLLMKWLASGDL